MRYRVITDTVTNEVVEFVPEDEHDWEILFLVCESGVIIPWGRVQRLVPVRGDQ